MTRDCFREVIEMMDGLLLSDQGKEGLMFEQVISDLGVFGPHAIHRIFYDGGVFNQELVRNILLNKPDGEFCKLIEWLIVQRIGDYSESTLRRMYGLES